MIIYINTMFLEIVYALFILANNIYTTYLIIINKECIKYTHLFDVGILSILNNMITFSLVSIFIIRNIKNKYYEMIFAVFTLLSAVGCVLLLDIMINNDVINGEHCNHRFFYIVIINVISSIIPVILMVVFFIGLVIIYIPYDTLKRSLSKNNYVSRYSQTGNDDETISLMDNNSAVTFIFPPSDIYNMDDGEV